MMTRGPGPHSPWTLWVAALATLLACSDALAQRRRGGPPIALKVGTVHPVSGPAIENGVVIIRRGVIQAVGPADSTEIPEGAAVLEYPEAHAYPGLVDALSTAFVDGADLRDGSTDAGSTLTAGLNPYDDKSRGLAAAGVTTAFISARSDRTWRGVGRVIRPTADGFQRFRGQDRAALCMRVSSGSANQHPLQRRKALRAVGKDFESLEAYEKAKTKYDEDKKKYDEEFEKYLDWHRMKKKAEDAETKDGDAEKKEGDADKKTDASGEKSGDGERTGRPTPESGGGTPPDGENRRRRGRRPGAGGGFRRGGEARSRSGGARPGGASRGDGDAEKGEKKDEAPKRPKAPKKPKVDEAKETLIAVRDGDLLLRVEARREEEIEAVLAAMREHSIDRVVLEHADAATDMADDLATAGLPVVVTATTPPAPKTSRTGERTPRAQLAATLHAAGVPVAIGSGSVDRARFLPLLAAQAAGYGLDADAAIRAITLTAAEILGVARRVGSLERGKYADVLITSGPLLASDSRIVRVLSSGRTVYEAK